MAGTLQQQLDSIRAKATVLVERYNKLAQAHRQALSSVAELEGRLAESGRRLDEIVLRLDEHQSFGTEVHRPQGQE